MTEFYSPTETASFNLGMQLTWSGAEFNAAFPPPIRDGDPFTALGCFHSPSDGYANVNNNHLTRHRLGAKTHF